ncbi:S8 family serine peptidase [Streptomyces sp. NPDC050610]|uniref:S8 family serine peptidase n=1 Tax=Streptomyces sp. NPDC050610 TaxID=3157097 RepID=UPI00341F9917
MRPISRTALAAASAAVLAVTAFAPSAAGAPHGGGDAGKRPIAGSEAARAAAKQGGAATVTLVTGDRVQVVTDSQGHATATPLPDSRGRQPLVRTRQLGKDLYVYPESATAALAAKRVDEELFNVTGLIRQGYDDAHTGDLPLIATYEPSVNVARSAPAAPRGARRGLLLPAVDGVALKADKKQAGQVWQDVADRRSRSGSGLRKLWLDRKVATTLDRSTKQVHADQAWAAGYDGKGAKVAVLDTGVDAGHPDLKGRVADSRNFTDSPSTDDRQGHGTHTASTVGGSGAASGGKKKGVAPGADLLIGKVLNDSGSGASSWIIAGMQWAVDQKADVVSMSLGSPEPSDCTDPMSEAARQLADGDKTLFVVAAGNAGPAKPSVTSPGCVPDVLTVGAVDRDDTTAQFSSRGPVLTTHTLKPEIAAPGVGISAAAAGGRGVYAYQTMSGTSMATPHVAGAAAIVRQAHPDWTARQVKAALVGSAQTGGKVGGADETGGGRLDAGLAYRQPVLGASAVQGGSFSWPQDSSDRTSVDVPYTNTTGADVKLTLSVSDVRGNDGSSVTSGMARLGKRQITVPAGGTVRVPLRLDPSAHLKHAQYGDVSGRIIAKGKGVRVSVPFALYIQPQTVTLRVKLIDRDGAPARGASSLDVVSTDASTGEQRVNDGAKEQLFHVRPGDYLLSSFVTSGGVDANSLPDSVSYLAHPQLDLTKDTTVVLDARKAHRLTVRTDRKTEVRRTVLSYGRWWDDAWATAGSLSAPADVKKVYASVVGKARDGGYEFSSNWRAYGSDAKGPYVYNLSYPERGPLGSDRAYRTRDKKLAAVTARWNAVGKAADYADIVSLRPTWNPAATVGIGVFDQVHAPSTRTEYYTPGGGSWQHQAQTTFPFAAVLQDQDRTYRAGERRDEEWYRGVLRPDAARDAQGKALLVAERQGGRMGIQPAFWNDGSGDHWSYGGSFGDIGNMTLRRDGKTIGESPYPYGVFDVPDGDAAYELQLNTTKLTSSDRNWLRSTDTTTTWNFRSRLEPDVYSRGLPVLFPAYDLPVDGLNTLPAAAGQHIRLSAHGHAGYEPGKITKASLAYSYDGGTTLTNAKVAQQHGTWNAVVDHTGASGKPVTLKVSLTDAKGNSVTQMVKRAYDVR